MTYQDILKTRLQSHARARACEPKRRKRIQEALGWGSGTRDNPRKHLVTTLPNGIDVCFLKPGKEVFSVRRPNPYDMTPVVGSPDKILRFDEIWSYLSKISVVNFDSFKAVLTLTYRNAYLMDHVEEEAGIIRYQPSEEIARCIDSMNDEIGDILPFGLMGFLHLLDILGWNEDVKYHTEHSRPTFSGRYNFKVGRINTLLTCIRVPYQASLFVRHVIDTIDNKRNIDFQLLFTIMQQFATSRGTCTPTQQKLIAWLSPYIIEGQ